MEVAGEIAVLNHGRLEQVGTPRDLYEQPANQFVMEFIGAVNRLGTSFVRPHDVELTLEPNSEIEGKGGGEAASLGPRRRSDAAAGSVNGATREAQIERIIHLGFEVRVELVLHDGSHLSAVVTRDEAAALELEAGQIVFVRPTRETVFAASA